MREDGNIRHEKIIAAPGDEAGTTSVRRYQASRTWSVSGLALMAAAGAVLTTGLLSAAVDGGPEPAFAGGIRRSVASADFGMAAQAAVAPAPVPAASPPPAGEWQVQVGAFRSTAAAEAHLRALERELPELARLTPAHQLRGRLSRVRIGGIADDAAAQRLCARVEAVAGGCFVVRPES